MSWRVVDAKWAGFRADFHQFDPAVVAAMDDSAIRRIETDPQVIRNVRKLEATVLSSFAEPTDAVADLSRRFKFLGPSGASRLLLSVSRSVAMEPHLHRTWIDSPPTAQSKTTRATQTGTRCRKRTPSVTRADAVRGCYPGKAKGTRHYWSVAMRQPTSG